MSGVSAYTTIRVETNGTFSVENCPPELPEMRKRSRVIIRPESGENLYVWGDSLDQIANALHELSRQVRTLIEEA